MPSFSKQCGLFDYIKICPKAFLSKQRFIKLACPMSFWLYLKDLIGFPIRLGRSSRPSEYPMPGGGGGGGACTILFATFMLEKSWSPITTTMLSLLYIKLDRVYKGN
jgi:hypothetical protein